MLNYQRVVQLKLRETLPSFSNPPNISTFASDTPIGFIVPLARARLSANPGDAEDLVTTNPAKKHHSLEAPVLRFIEVIPISN